MQSFLNKKMLIIFTLIYSFSVMIALLFPFYLYIQESVTNLKNAELIKVKKETSDIKLQVCITGNIELAIKSREQYKVAFFDKDGDMLYSNRDDFTFNKFDKEKGIDGDNVYKIMNLEKERGGATKFVVVKKLDFSAIYMKVMLLVFYILAFLVVSSGVLIYFSTKSITQTNRYLEQFFNDAMHEIRTPLGIIQFNLDMLSETIKKSNGALLNRTQAAAKSLTSIYEDIEYFIKYKKVDYQKEKINLSSFLLDRVEFIEVLAKIKNIELKTNIEENIHYLFNRIELQRIIDNNISNAIKYSKENTTITITLKNKADKICLIFEDEGVGMEDTSQIFTRYYRGDEIKGGFGMGLSIVREICNKYNIEIKVESEVKKGSKFIYILNKT